jgi:hypothetical protein
MALARLDRHKPFAAVGEPLEPDGGERIRCQKAAEHQSQSDESLLHNDTPMFFLKPVSANDTGYAKARRIASVDRTAHYSACHSPVMIPCQGRVGVFVSVGALFFDFCATRGVCFRLHEGGGTSSRPRDAAIGA